MSGWKKVFLVLLVLAGAAIVIGPAIHVGSHRYDGFVVTKWWATIFATVVLVLMTLVIDWMAKQTAKTGAETGQPEAAPPQGAAGEGAAPDIPRERRAGVKSLIMGTDGRASTSKAQAVLWTYAVLFVLVYLLFVGHTISKPTDCGPKSTGHKHVCQGAPASLSKAFSNVVDQPLKAEYFALLGIPYAAAVAAKALTTTKVANGDLFKSAPSSGGVSQGLVEIVGNDRGEIDSLDFQYAIFNLFAVIYFFAEFFTHPAQGLPTIPETLLVLSGVSGTAYATKKALETSVGPYIGNALPSTLTGADGGNVTITGLGFIPDKGKSTDYNGVTLNGVKLDIVGDWTAKHVVATVPAGTAVKADAPLVVIDDEGNASDPFKVQIT
jgi:hypothetical protein